MAVHNPEAERLAVAGQSAAAYIEKKWGVPTKGIPLIAVAVPASGGIRALQNNPRRFFYAVFNPSSGSVYWGNSNAEALLNAVLISPLGGSLQAAIDEDGEAVTYEVWLNAASALTCYVLEIVRK